MEKKDLKHLGAMLEAAKDAREFAKGKQRDDLDRDRQLTLSLVKCLEMLGQAAAKVSKECQESCEPIAWEQVIHMKHQIVHTYWEIDRDWVWERVTNDLPTLVEALNQILRQQEN